ncbi:MAG: hypothetical protein ACRDJF_08835 [Actinomycetota bacterium]
MLARRAAAVNTRDRGAFLASIDSGATGFVETQGTWFDRMGALPILDYSLESEVESLGELTRAADRRRYGSPVVVAQVQERFRIQGFDDHPASSDHYYTFVKRAEGWRIASDSDLSDLGLLSARQPWDFGPIQLFSSDHFLLVVHPDEVRFAPELLRLAEEALPTVDRVWRRPWSKRVLIFVPSSPEELEGLLNATFDVSNFVAFASASLDREAGWRFTGARIILNRANFLRHTPSSRREIFAHELAHAATREASGPFVPVFVEEAMAELASADLDISFLEARARSGGFDRRLPGDPELLSGDGQAIYLSYQEALSVALFVRDRFGVETFNRLYEALGAARVEAGTRKYHLNRVLTETLGMSLANFEREWGSYVAGRAG